MGGIQRLLRRDSRVRGGGHFWGGKEKIFVKGDMSKFWLMRVSDPPFLSRESPDICSGDSGYTNQEFETKNSVFLKL